jgi:hypothetical protein
MQASTIARGTFEVVLTPVETTAPLGRMRIEKVFHGDLDGTSVGEMLSVRTEVKGSAGYVAMELVTGTLCGRRGGFALQHFGIMNRGESELRVVVVPDSGTEELHGLSGAFAILIADGVHSYEFKFNLPETT